MSSTHQHTNRSTHQYINTDINTSTHHQHTINTSTHQHIKHIKVCVQNPDARFWCSTIKSFKLIVFWSAAQRMFLEFVNKKQVKLTVFCSVALRQIWEFERDLEVAKVSVGGNLLRENKYWSGGSLISPGLIELENAGSKKLNNKPDYSRDFTITLFCSVAQKNLLEAANKATQIDWEHWTGGCLEIEQERHKRWERWLKLKTELRCRYQTK
jgi:hypothetical protein